MTPELMAARLAQIDTELADLVGQLGNDAGDRAEEIEAPVDRLTVTKRIEELREERQALVQLLTDTPGSPLG